jgi:hypothetical protein
MRNTASAVALVGMLAAGCGGATVGDTQDRQRVTSASPVPPAASMRLVGLGHAAIAVPDDWGTNVTRCGVPKKDTVVIDVGAVPACGTSRPKDVESVEVTQGKPRFDFQADEFLAVDGVRAQRQATTCAPGGFGGPRVCVGTVHIPSMRVSFRAESSTSAAEVERILDRIRIVPDQVGVPGYQLIALDQQGRSGQKYIETLREAGLTTTVRTKKLPAVSPGYVLDVSPQPGTIVNPGAVVTVTLVAEPSGPADEVRVGMNSVDAAGEDYKDLDDAQIRAGATIKLHVGDRIWAYAEGKRSSTLSGELDGDSLRVDHWKKGPNYLHSWVAVAPSRTRVRLSIIANDEPVALGVVTVKVD